MKALENRTLDSKNEMDIMDALEELQVRCCIVLQYFCQNTGKVALQSMQGQMQTVCIVHVFPPVHDVAHVSRQWRQHQHDDLVVYSLRPTLCCGAGREGPAQQGQPGGRDRGDPAEGGAERRGVAAGPGRGAHPADVLAACHAGVLRTPANSGADHTSTASVPAWMSAQPCMAFLHNCQHDCQCCVGRRQQTPISFLVVKFHA